MVQLNIQDPSGETTAWVVNRWPILLGRGAEADIRLEREGVWDQHAQIDWKGLEGFHLTPLVSDATEINGQLVESETRLRNGDWIGLGGAKIQFWLSEVGQRRYRVREVGTFVSIGLLILAQVALVYWLEQL